MDATTFLFDSEQLNRLFPFYILINSDLKICGHGKSLEKILPGLHHKHLNAAFFITQPKTVNANFNTLKEIANQLVTLESADDNKIFLKGQFEFLSSANQILFVGSPLFGSVEEIKKINLDLNDFAAHDTVIDFLKVLKTQEIANDDIKKLLKLLNNQRSELKRLSFIAEETINGVIITDANDRIQWVNKSFERITGYTLNEVAGKVPGNFLQGRDSDPKTISYLQEKVHNFLPFECELLNYSKSGNPYWIKISGQPIFDKKGNTTQFFSLQEDITQRKKAEESLKKAEERWQFALEGTGDGLWEYNFQTKEVFYSQGYKKMLGFTDDEFKNELYEWSSRIHSDDLIVIEKIDNEYEEGRINNHQREYRIKNKQGNFLWILDRGMIISRTADGKPLRMIGTHTDITQRKLIENKLVLNEKRYRDLFNYSQALICTHDLKGKILSVNPTVCESLGYSSEELTGKMLKEFIPPKDAENFDAGYLNKITKEERRKGVFRIMHKNGNLLFLLYQNYMVKEEGLESYVIGFSQDITERIKAEKELVLAKKITEDASHAKEVFLANMSHEIRTPMTGILGIAGLLVKTNLDEQQKNYTNLIIESANNLLVIVNDVLDIEKIASGKIEFEHLPFRIPEKVTTTIQSFQYKAAEKGLQLDFENNLHSDLVVEGDPYRLSQILNNLLSNALKFTEHGKIIVSASLLKKDTEIATIKFTVRDTGIGIPDGRLLAIFDPFVQASTDTTRKYGGTGLGLSICKNLVEMQGGEISAHSEKDKGTTFSFIMPYKISSSQIVIDEIKEEINFREIGKKKVLVAEDVELNQFLAKHILESWGFTVDIANNGKEAVNNVKEKNYDLILMDIQMPEMDGIEATQIIRGLETTDKSNIPIIALTANALKGDGQMYLEAGMNDYITKPYTEERLYKVISKFLKPNKQAANNSETNKEEAIAIEKLYNLSMVNMIGKDNPAFAGKMVKLFLDTVPSDLEKLEDAVDKEDWAKLSFTAHKMKSTIDSMGITSISAVIRKLEMKDEKKENKETILSWVKEVNAVLGKVIEQMRADFHDIL